MGLFESEAREEFSRLDPSDDLFREMLAGLKNHAASDLWQDRRNIPTLATWLRERQWERPEVIAARKAALSGRAMVTPKPGAAQAEDPFDDSPKSPAPAAVPTPPPGPKDSEISQQVREMLGANAERVGLGDEVEAMLVVAQWRGQHISPEAIYAGARALVSRPPESWTPAALDGLVRQGSGVTLH